MHNVNMSLDLSLPGGFSILNHQNPDVLGVKPDIFKALTALIQNGLYYVSVGNNVSALVSFSSAATMIFTQQQIVTGSPKVELAQLMQQTLGYVEQLQTKVATLSPGGGGGSKGSGGKSDDAEDWEVECQNMCESSEPACIAFKDVVGMAKEKELIYSSIIKPLVYPNLYTKSAKGVLLYGPPGTGKTFLMKAAMKELQIKFPETAQVLFFPLTGADLKGKYVGETEKKIVRAYTCAARRACQASDPYNQTNPCNPKEAKAMFEKLSKLQDASDSDFNYKDVFECKPKYVSIIFIDEFSNPLSLSEVPISFTNSL